MPHPVVNTKIDMLTEAIEGLAVAVHAEDYDSVVAARNILSDALREFLAPTLRVVRHIDLSPTAQTDTPAQKA